MGGLLQQLAAAGAFNQPQTDEEPECIYLWPESVDAWEHWRALQTQWRAGMAGATGLDYAGVRAYLDECGVEPGPERRELFECIRACEHACLEVWAELRDKQPPPAPPPRNR